MSHLNPVQQKLLEMMAWYHAFCTEHSLRYFAIGGTMLGAVRHQGFIPWDDDLDVGMPRPDYERFISLMQTTGGHAPYIVETVHMNKPGYDFPYAKVYDTSTTLIENNKSRSRRGLFLDVYPLDGIGGDMRRAKKNFLPLWFRLNFLATRVCEVRRGRSPVKNAAVIAAKLIPDWLVDEHRAIIKIDRLCAKHNYDRSEIVGNLTGMRRYRELMPRATFGTPKEYQFEDITILGVEDAEDYLTRLFGDWRQLPPEGQRQTTHGFLSCDLTRSYLEE